ncbi:hypothetical protein ACTID9_27090 [Brevibacillus fluminis]|uniref:hypothetical protein n=1 Tax=Brevibacillus fluminis TaxID=511487 RepID=UPI003F8CC943
MLYELFTWLLVSYSCAGLIALIAAPIVGRIPTVSGKTPILVKLHLYQSAEQLEAVVRRLHFASRKNGTPVRILLADHGSTDDTPAIIKILERNKLLFTTEESASAPAYVLDLRDPSTSES